MDDKKMDQINNRSSGKPLPPLSEAAGDPVVGADVELPEPAPIEKTLSTLVSELRARVSRDQQTRSRRDH